MEIVATLAHRYVVHGPVRCWHRSDHAPRRVRRERNDLFAVLSALPSVALVNDAIHGHAWLLRWRSAPSRTARFMSCSTAEWCIGVCRSRVQSGAGRAGSCRRTTSITHEGALSFGFRHAPDPRELPRELWRRRADDRACRS